MSLLKKASLLMVVLACVLFVGGCAGRGSLSNDIDDSTGAYIYTADDAGKGSSVGSLGGGIDIAEGQVLTVNSELERGSLQLRLLDASGEVVLNEEITGQTITSHELEPGSYSIGVTCNEDGTTGTVTVVPKNEDGTQK